MTRDDNITWGETVDELDRLRAELARTQLERDEARAQFDNHVAWASDSIAELEAELSEERHAHNKTQFDLAEARKEKALIVAWLREQVERFRAAIAAFPFIQEGVDRGDQFNAYENAENDEDDHPDDLEFYFGIGPIDRARFFLDFTGKRKADLVEAAFKLAHHATHREASTADLRAALATLVSECDEEIDPQYCGQSYQDALDAARKALGGNDA